MIIEPWGIVIARSSEKEGIITAHIDIDEINCARQSVPGLTQRNPDVYGV